MSLRGADASSTTIERDPNAPGFRILFVAGTGNLTLDGISITGGDPETPAGFGGGIANEGTTSIINSIVILNRSGFMAVGGGISNSGTMNVSRSTIVGNFVQGSSGGGISNTGKMTITQSAVFENLTFDGFSGAISNRGTLEISNSTIARNRADEAGAITNSGTLLMTNSTVAGNSAFLGGTGGISSGVGTTTLQNTIVADNMVRGLATDCLGALISLGNNFIGEPTGYPPETNILTPCDIEFRPTDLIGDAGLGDFIDDIAPGQAHFPLLPEGPAINAGNNDVCLKDAILATDQLGQPRVGICDMGAIEFQPEPKIVSVVVRPHGPDNKINPNSNALIRVAILSTSSFDARGIDQASLRLGPNQAPVAGTGSFRDVDRDGLRDLVLQFQIQATGIQCGDTSISLVGRMADGTPFEGSDSIVTVGCKANPHKKK